MNYQGGLNGKKCVTCGKRFYPTPEWVYKTSSEKYFCTYGCMRKYQSTKRPRKRAFGGENCREIKSKIIMTMELIGEPATARMVTDMIEGEKVERVRRILAGLVEEGKVERVKTYEENGYCEYSLMKL